MKTCPICEAKAFDDALVCYGCLHRFGEEEKPSGFEAAAPNGAAAVLPAVAEGPESGAVFPVCEEPVQGDLRVAPLQAIIPAPGGWTMRVEFSCGAPVAHQAAQGKAAAEPERRYLPVFAMTEEGLVIHVNDAPGAARGVASGRAAGRGAARGGRAVRPVLRRRGRQAGDGKPDPALRTASETSSESIG